MKVQVSILATLLSMGLACSNASEFEGAQATKKSQKKSDDAAGRVEAPQDVAEPAIQAEPEPEAEEPIVSIVAASPPVEAALQEAEQSIKLVAPDSVRAGMVRVQAKANLAFTSRGDKVVWKIAGKGSDIGTIDQNGLYVSPNWLKEELEITITASIEGEPEISASKVMKVIPKEQLFVGCQVGDSVFPITAVVYEIPVGQNGVPDFAKIADKKMGTVCMDKYDVPTRNFSEGFPGVSNRYEWFALKTSTRLIIEDEADYEFDMLSDDGSNLYIDGIKVIDNDGTHSPLAKQGSIHLKPGVHKFDVHWYQGPAHQLALQIKWRKKGSNDAFVVVPTASFSAVE